jgi:GDP-mannose 6-dehydrogenase
MLKYACNAFHATKITFANEIGRVARELNVDGTKVMDLLCRDTVLNISSAYMRPGFAYGGSCLPKDLRALIGRARLQNTYVPLLESLAWSNQIQIEHAYEIIAQAVQSKEETIGFLGLSFKAGTDDMRESPMVELVERFIGKGYRLLLYDKYVSLTRLMGTNKQYIQQEIPHLAELMAEDVAHVLRKSKVLVVVNRKGPYGEVLAQADAKTRILCIEDILSGHIRL